MKTRSGLSFRIPNFRRKAAHCATISSAAFAAERVFAVSVAVLKEPKVKIDREAVMRELLDNIDFITNEGLMKINVFVAEELERECDEYVPHSFDDLPEETRRAFEDAVNGIGLGEPVSVEEFKKWVCEVAAEARAEMAANGKINC